MSASWYNPYGQIELRNYKRLNMSDVTTEKKLPKHLASAVNQLEKQQDKYDARITKLVIQRGEIQGEIDDLKNAHEAISEQIKRLKGE